MMIAVREPLQELIMQEAVMLKRQRHPNIMELYAAFVDDHFLWMILPFVPGGSLETLLKKGYPKVLLASDVFYKASFH